MKRTTIGQTSSRLAVVVTLLGLAATPKLEAEFACAQERMAGAWVHHAELFIFQREGSDIFPPPGTFSEVGIIVLDEQGKANIARQTNSSVGGISRPNFIPMQDVQAVINPDCTGRWLFTVRDDLPPEHPFISVFGFQGGQVVFDLDLVCADGQLECWATFTEPAAIFTGIVKLKRVEAFNAELEIKLDGLSTKVDAIMRRLGIPQAQ